MKQTLTKRYRILALLFALALVAAACGDDDTASSTTTASNATTTTAPSATTTTSGTTGTTEPSVQPGPGITADTVKLGATADLTGPAAVFGQNITGGAQLYFDKVNAEGGVVMGDGVQRMIEFQVYDDGFEAARGVENSRRLCEQDEVFLMTASVGVPAIAAEEYANQEECPSVMIAGGSASLSAPGNDYQLPLWPPIASEGAVYGRYILDNLPGTEVAFLQLNAPVGDDFGSGLKAALEAAGASDLLVAEETLEGTDPSVESQMNILSASDAGAMVLVSTPGPAAQVVSLNADLGWNTQLFYYSANAQIPVLEPAGLDKATGIISSTWIKDVSDTSDSDVVDFLAAGGTAGNATEFQGWVHGAATVELLKLVAQPTRESVLEAMYSLNGVAVPGLAGGVTMTTSATDSLPIQAYQVIQFNGVGFDKIGGVIDVSGG